MFFILVLLTLKNASTDVNVTQRPSLNSEQAIQFKHLITPYFQDGSNFFQNVKNGIFEQLATNLQTMWNLPYIIVGTALVLVISNNRRSNDVINS